VKNYQSRNTTRNYWTKAIMKGMLKSSKGRMRDSCQLKWTESNLLLAIKTASLTAFPSLEKTGMMKGMTPSYPWFHKSKVKGNFYRIMVASFLTTTSIPQKSSLVPTTIILLINTRTPSRLWVAQGTIYRRLRNLTSNSNITHEKESSQLAPTLKGIIITMKIMLSRHISSSNNGMFIPQRFLLYLGMTLLMEYILKALSSGMLIHSNSNSNRYLFDLEGIQLIKSNTLTVLCWITIMLTTTFIPMPGLLTCTKEMLNLWITCQWSNLTMLQLIRTPHQDQDGGDEGEKDCEKKDRDRERLLKKINFNTFTAFKADNL